MTLPYPDKKLCTCNALPNGHPKVALNDARTDGRKAYRRRTGSRYLFCAQMEAAFSQGYAQESAKRLAA